MPVFNKRAIDMTGKTCGFLTVLRPAKGESTRNAHWLCLCRCGNTAVVTGQHLRNGAVKTCGCKMRRTACVGGSLGALVLADLEEFGPRSADDVTASISGHRPHGEMKKLLKQVARVCGDMAALPQETRPLHVCRWLSIPGLLGRRTYLRAIYKFGPGPNRYKDRTDCTRKGESYLTDAKPVPSIFALGSLLGKTDAARNQDGTDV